MTSARRFADEPELPTVAESGLPGNAVTFWYGIYAPAKTPADIIKKINADMASPALKEKLKLLGVEAHGSTPAELAAKNHCDAALWGPIIKDLRAPDRDERHPCLQIISRNPRAWSP